MGLLVNAIILELGKLDVQPAGYEAPKGFRIKFVPKIKKTGKNMDGRYVDTLVDMLETIQKWDYPYKAWDPRFKSAFNFHYHLDSLITRLGYEQEWLNADPQRQKMYSGLLALRDTLIARGEELVESTQGTQQSHRLRQRADSVRRHSTC
jgi:hypothetical protein